jgi:hypothetical protein
MLPNSNVRLALSKEAHRRLNPELPPAKPKIPRGQQKRYLQEFQDAKAAGELSIFEACKSYYLSSFKTSLYFCWVLRFIQYTKKKKYFRSSDARHLIYTLMSFGRPGDFRTYVSMLRRNPEYYTDRQRC